MLRSLFLVRGVGLSVCAMLICIAGCSSKAGGPAKLAPVAGIVKLDGSPLTGANVIFIPRDQTKAMGGSGVTGADGKYEARHQSNKVGIEPGTYTVLFSKIAMPDGSPIPEGKNAADVGAVEVLPQQLSNPNPEFVTNIVTIPDAGGAFDFDLASK